MCSNLFFLKKTFYNHPRFSVLSKSFSNIFCWNFFAEGGDRNPLENLSQFVLYPLLFWKKKKDLFHLFLQMSFFLFLFRFVFSFFALQLLVIVSYFFQKKNYERRRCNGCPADQISDNWTHIDFTSSTTWPHTAVIRRASNHAMQSSTHLKKVVLLGIKNCLFHFLFKKNIQKTRE